MEVSKEKGARTKNRKYISHSKIIKHGDIEYEINPKNYAFYPEILHKTIEQLEVCELKWRRVFILRFDLHQAYYCKDSKHISRFRKNLNRKLERHYGMNEAGYVWVREQERAKHQHYHFVLFLDGNKIRHSSKILEAIKETWIGINLTNHMPVIKNPFYFMDNEETKVEAIKRISYLAKTRSKGYRDKRANDYSTSRLVAPAGK